MLTYLMLRLIHDESCLEASLRRNRCVGWLALCVVLGMSELTICLHDYICCFEYCAIARNWALRPWQFHFRQDCFMLLHIRLGGVGISWPKLIAYVRSIWCTH
jgi:hypothetical protein